MTATACVMRGSRAASTIETRGSFSCCCYHSPAIFKPNLICSVPESRVPSSCDLLFVGGSTGVSRPQERFLNVGGANCVTHNRAKMDRSAVHTWTGRPNTWPNCSCAGHRRTKLLRYRYRYNPRFSGSRRPARGDQLGRLGPMKRSVPISISYGSSS